MSDPSIPDLPSPGYSGMAAALYDALRGDDPLAGEYEYYRRELEGVAGPHLEIGSGTGRILLRLLRAGLEVEGLECSADMLRLCRAKAAASGLAPKLYHQDMQTMRLSRRYGTIFVPLVTLSLLQSADELSTVFYLFRQHLRPGGRLLFSLCAPPDRFAGPWWPPREVTFEGRVVRVSQSSTTLPEDDAIVEHFRFEVVSKPPTLLGEHHLRLRFWRSADVAAILTACGYEAIEVARGHGGPQPAMNNPVRVFKASTPGPGG